MEFIRYGFAGSFCRAVTGQWADPGKNPAFFDDPSERAAYALVIKKVKTSRHSTKKIFLIKSGSVLQKREKYDILENNRNNG
jgi:hypothetical protein